MDHIWFPAFVIGFLSALYTWALLGESSRWWKYPIAFTVIFILLTAFLVWIAWLAGWFNYQGVLQ